MGNVPAGEVPQQISIRNVKRRLSKRSLVAKWQTRNLPEQVFGVIRHAERADGAYAFFSGGRWTQTSDFMSWPLDPPLSDGGLEAAADIGEEVADFCKDANTRFHVVISSPYARCVQTAAEICQKLGPSTRLIIDRSVGEVFGPSVMGQVEPVMPVRPMSDAVEWCQSVGVQVHGKPIGTWPCWPEDLKAARRRYANRFLTYLQRSNTARRNFLLVTHADGVGAALSMMPSQVGKTIASVEYGGLFLARRPGKKPAALGRHASPTATFQAVLPGMPNEDAATDGEGDDLTWATRTEKGLWLSQSESVGCVDTVKAASSGPPAPPKASDGWRVEVRNINLTQRPGQKNSPNTFVKRLQALAKDSHFSQKQMEALLGELAEQPLGGAGEELQDYQHPSRRQRQANTSCSMSTYLFGASDTGSEIGNSEPRWTETSLDGAIEKALAIERTFSNSRVATSEKINLHPLMESGKSSDCLGERIDPMPVCGTSSLDRNAGAGRAHRRIHSRHSHQGTSLATAEGPKSPLTPKEVVGFCSDGADSWTDRFANRRARTSTELRGGFRTTTSTSSLSPRRRGGERTSSTSLSPRTIPMKKRLTRAGSIDVVSPRASALPSDQVALLHQPQPQTQQLQPAPPPGVSAAGPKAPLNMQMSSLMQRRLDRAGGGGGGGGGTTSTSPASPFLVVLHGEQQQRQAQEPQAALVSESSSSGRPSTCSVGSSMYGFSSSFAEHAAAAAQQLSPGSLRAGTPHSLTPRALGKRFMRQVSGEEGRQLESLQEVQPQPEPRSEPPQQQQQPQPQPQLPGSPPVTVGPKPLNMQMSSLMQRRRNASADGGARSVSSPPGVSAAAPAVQQGPSSPPQQGLVTTDSASGSYSNPPTVLRSGPNAGFAGSPAHSRGPELAPQVVASSVQAVASTVQAPGVVGPAQKADQASQGGAVGTDKKWEVIQVADAGAASSSAQGGPDKAAPLRGMENSLLMKRRQRLETAAAAKQTPSPSSTATPEAGASASLTLWSRTSSASGASSVGLS